MNRPVLHLHIYITKLNSLSLREAVCKLTAYHSAYDTILVYFHGVAIHGLHCRSVTDYSDLIRHVYDLIKLMADYYHCHALLLEFEHQIKKSS